MYKFIHNMTTNNNNNNRMRRKMNMPSHNITPIYNQPTQAKTVSLFSQPYLDTYNQCYKNIVVINLMPQGPLAELVRFTHFPPLSEFKTPGPCSPMKNCGYALLSLGGYDGCCSKNGCDLMVVDEVPNLISYLVSNNYKVDTSITKMFNGSDIRFDTSNGNKLICFVTYNGTD